MDIVRFLRAASFVVLAASTLAATHCVAQAATARSVLFRPKVAVVKPRPLFRVNGARPLTTLRYTIVDRGAPSELKLALDEFPIVFNNTGQIAGIAYDSVAQRNVCELYDGKRFRDLSAAMSITECNVDAIGDASADVGAVDVVGYAKTLYAVGDSKAFYADAPLASGGIKTTIFPNDGSLLTGVNASGNAVGIGDYQPNAGFATGESPLFATPGRGSLAVVQPACTTLMPGCGSYNRAFFDEDDAVCPFGGCQITADGTLLLDDLYTGLYETVAPDGSAHDIVLAADLNSIPTINNANQLVYSIVSIVAGVTLVRAQIYTIATGSVTTIPALPGNSCRQYTPLSMNNEGHVLGYTSDCPLSDETYFTYDPTHGTQDLVTAIPAISSSLFPQAVNDNGEILIGLTPPGNGPAHWALLEPIAGDARRLSAASGSHWAFASPARSSIARSQRRIAAPAVRKSRPGRLAARLVPRPLRLHARAVTSAAPLYSVVDYGAPAVSNYALEMPVALNNTGQIVGIARDLPYVNGSTCILFDGARFRNISASPTITNCTPRSIADESSAGRLAVVGTALAVYSERSFGEGDQKAFESTIAPSTGVVGTTLFGGNDMSDLTGINASGLAIGVGDYLVAGFAGTDHPFFLAPGKLSLDLLQTPCVKAGVDCGYLLELSCAFGGCNITADGSLYLYSEVVDPSGSVQPVRLDGDAYGTIMNDAKQILYTAAIAHRSSPDTALTRIYQVGTGAVTTLPQIAGSTCHSYVPISFNNVGQVLGFTDDCTLATDQTYYIYDPVDGTRDLLAELPPGNASIEPIGVNDKGEIAFGLALPSGITHWGLLEPNSGSARHRVPTARLRAH